MAMAVVEESVLVRASLAETWDHYFDPRGWGSWVDGYQAAIESEGYPEPGGVLRWRSVPAGRGEVTERVLEHEPRRRHRVAFADPAMEGELETVFEIEGEGTRVGQRLSYRLLDRGPIARLGAVLFVRGQLRQSVQRSLLAFRRAAEEAANLPA
jgi:Polyketide cyclase / dehydrase and lipid transport